MCQWHVATLSERQAEKIKPLSPALTHTNTHTHNPLFNKTNWTTLKHTDLCCLPFILLNLLTASCSLLLGDLHLPALLSV